VDTETDTAIVEEVLLYIVTTSPAENVLLGIMIAPPVEPIVTNLPTSEVARVYVVVFEPEEGMFLNPTVMVSAGKVIV